MKLFGEVFGDRRRKWKVQDLKGMWVSKEPREETKKKMQLKVALLVIIQECQLLYDEGR